MMKKVTTRRRKTLALKITNFKNMELKYEERQRKSNENTNFVF